MSTLGQRNLTPKPKKKSNVGWIITIVILVILIIVTGIVAWLIGGSSKKKIIGESCKVDTDCEAALACTNLICTVIPIPENPIFGDPCDVNGDCNNPLTCVNNICQCPILDAPEGIVVTGIALGSIKIEWDEVVGASGYIVYGTQNDPPTGLDTDEVVAILNNNIFELTLTGFPGSVEIHSVRAIA